MSAHGRFKRDPSESCRVNHAFEGRHGALDAFDFGAHAERMLAAALYT